MDRLVPQALFLTHGTGAHREPLRSFEIALRDAGIAMLNLVPVSSIVPPGCRVITRQQGEQQLQAGQITFVVLTRAQSNEPHRMLAASVELALPRDQKLHGYLSEHHAFGQ